MSQRYYSIGDYVKIKNESSFYKYVVGKIEEILSGSSTSNKVIRYTLFFFPEDTKEGRQEHNSKNEIYNSTEIEKELYSNIISKCEVYSFENYLKRRIQKNTKNTYFYRQRYNRDTGIYVPDLDPSCYCEKIFNPDEEYAQCSKCKEYFHLACYFKSPNKKCFNELCNNIIENQMTTAQIEKLKTNYVGLGSKRKRSDDMQKPLVEEKYKNIPENNRLYLINLIENIERARRTNSNMTEIQKVRSNARDSFLFALYYGIEELKIKNGEFWLKIEKQSLDKKKLTRENLNDEDMIKKYCENLSIEIEFCLYSANNEVISSVYKRKLYTLITNLQNEINTELRTKILLGDIPPMNLVTMTSDELAPSSVKKRKMEQQNKYFKEQVYLDGEVKLIAKNHKGDTILSVDPKDRNNDGFISYNVLQKNSYSTKDFRDRDADMYGEREDNSDIVMKRNEMKKQLGERYKMKYKNISQDKIRFCVDLEDISPDYLTSRINERINILKPESIEELNKMRKEMNKIKLI